MGRICLILVVIGGTPAVSPCREPAPEIPQAGGRFRVESTATRCGEVAEAERFRVSDPSVEVHPNGLRFSIAGSNPTPQGGCCVCGDAPLFADGFETGDLSAWSAPVS